MVIWSQSFSVATLHVGLWVALPPHPVLAPLSCPCPPPVPPPIYIGSGQEAWVSHLLVLNHA